MAGGMVAQGITIKFSADTSGLTAGASQANSILGGFASMAGTAFLAAGAAAVAGGVLVTKMAGDFQSSMTTLVTGAGEARSNIKMVSDGILQMAVDTGTSTEQLSAGMYMVESAGFHGAAGLTVLKAAAEGAKVGNADLETTAKAVTAEMLNYATSNLTASQATNTLVATVSAGQVHMGELAGAMSNILPISSKAGISLTDVSAAMATMTAKGVPAADAATYLRQTIMALENPTKAAASEMTAMGLKSSDVAATMKTSLPDALQMITDAAGKKFPSGSSEYIAAIAKMVGGTKSLSGIMNLSGSDMAKFRENVENIASAVKSGGNSIKGWSDIQQDFNFKIDQAKEVVQTLGIKIGTQLLPVIGQLVSNIIPVVTQFGNWVVASGAAQNAANMLVAGITNISNALKNTISFFQQNEAAMTALKVGVIALAGAIGGALVAALILATVNFVMLNIAALPWIALALAIGAAVALLVAGFILLYNSSQGVRTFMAMLGGIFTQLGATIVSVLTPAWLQLVAAFQQAAPIFLVIAQVLGGVLLVALGVLIAAVAALAQGIAVALTGIIIVFTGVVNIISGIAQILGGLFMALMDVMTGRSDEAAAHLAMAWNGVLLMFQGFGQAVMGVFVTFFGFIVGFIAGFVTTIISYFQHLAAVVVGNSIIPDMVNAIISWFEQLPGRAGAAIASLIATAISEFNQLNVNAVNAIIAMVNGIVSQFQSLVGRAGAAIASVASTIIGGLNGIVGAATAAGANIVNGIAAGITGAIGAVGSAIGSVTQYIADHLPKSPAKIGPLRGLAQQGKDISNQISQGMLAGMPSMQSAIGKLTMPIYASLAGGKAMQAGNAAQPFVIQVQPNDVYIDGKKVTDIFVGRMAQGVRMQGVKGR